MQTRHCLTRIKIESKILTIYGLSTLEVVETRNSVQREVGRGYVFHALALDVDLCAAIH